MVWKNQALCYILFRKAIGDSVISRLIHHAIDLFKKYDNDYVGQENFVPQVRNGFDIMYWGFSQKCFNFTYIGPYIASCITSSNGHKLCREGNVSCMQHGTISFNRRFLAIKTLPSPTHTHFIHKRSQILFISFISDFIWEPWLIVDCFRGFHLQDKKNGREISR